jgi:ubiquitin-protein ligase
MNWDSDYNSPEFRLDDFVFSTRQRHELERAKLLVAWNTIEIDENDGFIVQLAGAVETDYGRVRDFYLTVPQNYPYEPPQSFPYGWELTGPHYYPNSEMCLWRPNQWQKNYTLAYAVAKTFTWIHKHEEYLNSGTWPGNEQRHP